MLSLCLLTESPQDGQPHVAAFLGVKLAAVHVAPGGRGRKRRAVLDGGDDGIPALLRGVRMDEIDVIPLPDVSEERGIPAQMQRILQDLRRICTLMLKSIM